MKWYFILLLPLCVLFLDRCANQTTPNGGPKDSIPPNLVSSNPEDNQRNFHGKVLTFTFDELVKLKDPKEIIITPSPGKDITIVAKQRNVTITPKNDWKENTTYSISFREAVQDITESLPVKNLHIAFSTGPIIDSLSISGNVAFALKETIPEKITVAIYSSDTFNIVKHQPIYFTETQKTGQFKINNLKQGIYYIYAFLDKNKNLKVDTQSEPFGFKRDSINLTTDVGKIKINLISIDSRILKVNNIRHSEKLSRIKFSKSTTNYNISNPGGNTIINNYGDNTSEVNIYHPILTDSVLLTLHATDSANQKLDTTFYLKSSASKTVKDPFKISPTESSFNSETNQLSAGVKLSIPIQKINLDTLIIKIDSANSIRITPEDIIIDSIRRIATFNCAIDKNQLKDLKTAPALYISKGALISIDGDSSNSIRTSFPLTKDEETSTLSLEVKTKEPNFEIEILTKDYRVVQRFKNQKQITFKNLVPSEYKIRAIIDKNNNGIWDSGSLFTKEEPETIVYLRNADKKFEFPVRANWEVGPLPFTF